MRKPAWIRCHRTNWVDTPRRSLLYDAGMSLDEIAELLGHKSTRMLEAHYKHPVRRRHSSGHLEHVDAIFGGRLTPGNSRTGCCTNRAH